MPAEHFPIKVGDVVSLKKKHPCGGYEWTICRTGISIGLVCTTCGRRVLLSPDDFYKRVKGRK